MNIQESYFKILEKIQKCKGYTESVKLVAVSKFKTSKICSSFIKQGIEYLQKIEFKKQETKNRITSRFKTPFSRSYSNQQDKIYSYYFDTVHSLCDLKVAHLLEKKCLELDKKMEVLLQMNLCQEEQKSGLLNYQELLQLAREILKLKHLNLVGLMTIPAFNLGSAETANIYSNLRKHKEKLAQELDLKEQLTELSMGMSGDFEIAIEEGATYVRIGTALFGNR